MKAKAARKKQAKAEIKEMKFRPKIDTGDYETKKKHILRFLDAGAKVKVTIMFRGREMAHPEIGLNILEKLAEDLRGQATIENQPKLEGRNMFMLIAPLKRRENVKSSSREGLGGRAGDASEAVSEDLDEDLSDDYSEIVPDDLDEDFDEDSDEDFDEDSDEDFDEDSDDDSDEAQRTERK